MKDKEQEKNKEMNIKDKEKTMKNNYKKLKYQEMNHKKDWA